MEKVTVTSGTYGITGWRLEVPAYTHLENQGYIYRASTAGSYILSNKDRDGTPPRDSHIIISGGVWDGKRNSGAGKDPNIQGLRFDNVDYLTIRDCKIQYNGWLPIGVFDCNYAQVINNIFQDNDDVGFVRNSHLVFANNVIKGSTDNGVSISRGNTYVNCVSNTITGASLMGIWLEGFDTESGPDHVTCTGNTIRNSGTQGIGAGGLQHSTIANNIIAITGNNGIKIWWGNYLARVALGLNVANNVIHGAGESGIAAIGCNACVIEGNVIDAPKLKGIYIRDTESLVVANNLIKYHGDDGIHVATALSPFSDYLTIRGNTVTAANLNTAASVYMYAIRDCVEILSNNAALGNTNAAVGYNAIALGILTGGSVCFKTDNWSRANDVNNLS